MWKWEYFVAFLSDPWGVAIFGMYVFYEDYDKLHFYLTRGELQLHILYVRRSAFVQLYKYHDGERNGEEKSCN